MRCFIVSAFVTLMTCISSASRARFEQAVERYKAKEFQIDFAQFYELTTDEHASAQVKRAALERAHSLIMQQMDLQQPHIARDHNSLRAICCI